MSADLSDPNIIEKYKEITSFTSPTNWCVLKLAFDALSSYDISTDFKYGSISGSC